MRWKSRAAMLSAVVAVGSCGPERPVPPFDEPLLAGLGSSAFERSPLHTASSARAEWRCEGGTPILYVVGKVTLRNRGSVPAEGLRLVDRTEQGLPDSGAWSAIGGSLEVPLSTLRPGETLEYEYEYPVIGWESAGDYRHSAWVTGPETDGEGETLTLGSELLAIEPPVNLCAVTCTLSGTYWRIQGRGASSSELWPVQSVTLGTLSYDAEELREILETRAGDDAILSLARELIATKLNVAAGADPRAVAPVIRAADALLGSRDLLTGGRVAHEATAASGLTDALAEYNAGATGPGACGAGAPTRPRNEQLRTTRVRMG